MRKIIIPIFLLFVHFLLVSSQPASTNSLIYQVDENGNLDQVFPPSASIGNYNNFVFRPFSYLPYGIWKPTFPTVSIGDLNYQKVEFHSIIFQQGTSPLLIDRIPNVTFYDCVFQNNDKWSIQIASSSVTILSSSFYGNSVPIISRSSSLTVRDSIFNNHSNRAILNDQIVTVFNCSFTNNSALDNGGAIVASDLYIYNSSFTDNNSTSAGGSVYGTNLTYAEGSQFLRNRAKLGGGISGSVLIVKNCTISDNVADELGGGAYAAATLSGMTVEDSKFLNNFAQQSGALFTHFTTIKGCYFFNNSAISAGGVLGPATETTIENSIFINNRVTGTSSVGGAISVTSANISSSDFIENQAVKGGALNVLSNGVVSKCRFTRNSAGNGGALSTAIGNFSLNNVVLELNRDRYSSFLFQEQMYGFLSNYTYTGKFHLATRDSLDRVGISWNLTSRSLSSFGGFKTEVPFSFDAVTGNIAMTIQTNNDTTFGGWTNVDAPWGVQIRSSQRNNYLLIVSLFRLTSLTNTFALSLGGDSIIFEMPFKCEQCAYVYYPFCPDAKPFNFVFSEVQNFLSSYPDECIKKDFDEIVTAFVKNPLKALCSILLKALSYSSDSSNAKNKLNSFCVDTIEAVDNLLNSTEPINLDEAKLIIDKVISLNMNGTELFSTLQKTVERVMQNVTVKFFSTENSGISVAIKRILANESSFISFTNNSASSSVPSSVFKQFMNESQAIVVFQVFANSPFLNSQRELFGNVVALSIQDSNSTEILIENSTEAIQITIPILQNLSGSQELECLWWNGNEWESSGCELTEKTEETVICSCNHLTNFTLGAKTRLNSSSPIAQANNAKSYLAVAIAVPIAAVLAIIAVVAAIFIIKSKKRRYNEEINRELELDRVQVLKSEGIDAGKLEIVEQVGTGASSSVWKATYGVGTFVALKKFSEKNEAFNRELKIHKNLKHPNIVQYMGIMCDTKANHIVMEYMTDGTLLDLVRTEALLKEQIQDILRQIANAMIYVHEQKYIHNDLSARNILIRRIGNSQFTAKLCDFGLTIKAGGSIKGEFATRWAAPEILEGKNPSYHSDIWSFGILIFEASSKGTVPYGESSNKQVASQVMEGFRLTVNQPFFSEIANDCWKADPKDRPSFSNILMRLGGDKVMQDLREEASKAVEMESSLYMHNSSNNSLKK